MLFCFAVVAEPDAAKGPHRRHLADQEKSGAFGTGSWTDTSPPNGCRTATKVAIWEPTENPATWRESLSPGRCAVTNGSRMGTC
jgi:hypothetical protein